MQERPPPRGALAEAVVADTDPYRRPGRRRRRGPGRTFYDWTPEAAPSPHGRHLIEALQHGDMTLARGLLMAQADPNSARDARGRTPLQLAASAGLAGICRQLVQVSAELDAGTVDGGLTALHLAAMNRHMHILKILLQAGACPNVCSSAFESPLKLCVNDGNIEGIQLLLKARAQVDPQEDEVPQASTLDLTRSACGGGAADGAGGLPAVVLDCSGEPRPTSAGALLRAMQRNGQKELVEELILARADVDAKDPDQNRPLHMATHHGRALDTRVVRMLLENRADPNACNAEMRTPMHCAAGAGLGRVVRMLTEFRGDVNREDRQGLTPLQMAADPAVAKQLSGLGARLGTSAYARSNSVPSLHGAGGPSGASTPGASGRASLRERGSLRLSIRTGSATNFVLSAPISPKSMYSTSPPSSPLSAGAAMTFSRTSGGKRGSIPRQPGAAWSGADF